MDQQAAGSAGAPAAAASTATVAAEAPLPLAHEFGWVPAEVVHVLLEEVGNFRARAAAIELLHAAVLDVASLPGGAAAVLPTLSAFLAFLLRLVADANFKIAISAMTILEDLVAQLGADLAPYLGTLAAALTERLGDNVQMVRRAASHALGALAKAVGPAPLLAALGGALVHPSWRVREEGLNAYTAALLAHSGEQFDYPACVRALAAAAGDEEPRVAAAALEAFALLHARLGALLQGMLTAVGADDGVKRRVAERARATPQLGLPALDGQGLVQHQSGEQLDSPESPGKAADRLNRLRQMADRRRVWSAPLHALEQADGSPADGSGSTGGAPAAAAEVIDTAAVQQPPSGSTGSRPGLQALKARARTARLMSSSGVVPGQASSSLYSMEAVDDVFGPDQPVRSSPWSPLKATPASSSPPKLLMAARSGSGSQWPDSPTGSCGTPSSRSSSWRAAGLGDPPSVAGSPKLGSASGFSPGAADTSPLAQPEAALAQAMAALQEAAASQRKELDWQAQYEALCTARRLARHHAAVVAPSLHALVLLASPVIDALRSTLSRLAIAVFQELAESLGPALDAELDAFLPLLLKRAGQASVAGRDNFLAVEADRALAALVAHGGEARVAAALLAALSSKSPDVRAKAAMHLDACVQQHGTRLLSGAVAVPGGALLPRLLRAAVSLLDEGGLEARTAGKRLLWALRRLLDGGGQAGDEFKRALARLDCKTDKVWDVFEAGQMPAAPVRLPSAGVRAASANPGGSGVGGLPSPGAGSGYASPFSPAKPSSLGPAVGGSSTPAVLSRSGSSSSGTAPGTAATSPTRRQPGGLGNTAATAAAPSNTTGAGSGASLGRPRGASRPASGRAAGAKATGSVSGGAGDSSSSAGSLDGLDAELQQSLEAAAIQLASKEWKERLGGLEALQQGLPAVQGPSAPAEAQLWAAIQLAQRAVDANLKVQQQALAALNAFLGGACEALTPAAPTLVPAACKGLDSGNPSVRQAAADALDCMLRWPPTSWLPPLMAALGSPAGAARGKALLLDRLVGFGPGLWQSRPGLVKEHVLPALFGLLAAERRPEVLQMVRGALAVLAKTMGPQLTAAAAALPQAQRDVVAEIVAAQPGG
ncbi:FAM179B isoform X2 [Chlorella sorokiniana]|uniref:FAM179B isoform X2 n=1 Tax=Chlorella sorokiniana TaxID=3076 RepID=A0A2P6U1M6_CHLSO|nr:FAM179B isoform X2 [Chlorella sorokiniana]|eukprot:PRW60199.1 FAM179B isoform X2 [Chlorella sorokiniana]